MKVSDYIVEYLINKGITDVFGYPGGMVTHLMDSLRKYERSINSHITYHEQAAAFSACGYAQASDKIGVAYATSGPGATNLITGICNAYFDSIPTLFITGNVNTYEKKKSFGVRQRGFQETDIVSMVYGVTKYSVAVNDPEKIKWHLDYACNQAENGRKGPVLLDIPMDVFRAEIDEKALIGYEAQLVDENGKFDIKNKLKDALQKAKRPLLLVGKGLDVNKDNDLLSLLRSINIPIATTMLAFNVNDSVPHGVGFIGAYGKRAANIAVSKCDLLITLGARLDIRQVGSNREEFAKDACIIRVDIDSGELDYKLHSDEIAINMDSSDALRILHETVIENNFRYDSWIEVCEDIKFKLEGVDDSNPNRLIEKISECMPEDAYVTADVGQNQVWIAQSCKAKENQRYFFSGGHGAMGYSLPSAVGVALATGKDVFCFNGDGGIQMNIQELQTVIREGLPIKIILLNNHSLGMIRHFQEMYFQGHYFQTMDDGGYTTPDFEALVKAYGLDYFRIENPEDITKDIFDGNRPTFYEVVLEDKTYVLPKLEYGKPYYMQEPYLDSKLMDYFEQL